MKKIFRNLTYGLLLCAGLFLGGACSDADDVIEEIPYTRVLTPLNFEAKVISSLGNSVTFTWSAVSNADGYVLEIFDGVVTVTTNDKGVETEQISAPDYENTPAALSLELGPDEVPYTLSNLPVDMAYYARVRAVSPRIENSHWTYLEEYVATYSVRTTLNPVITGLTESSISISWDDAEDKSDLTSIKCEPAIPDSGIATITTPLSSEEIGNAAATVEGLQANTYYKLTLLYGKAGNRGCVNAWTRPDLDGTYNEVSSAEGLNNALTQATEGSDVKIYLKYSDEPYDMTPYSAFGTDSGVLLDPIAFAGSLTILGESSSTGAQPTISNLGLTPSDPNGSLHFENLCLDGGNNSGVFLTLQLSADRGTYDRIEFVNCEICNYTKGIFSNPGVTKEPVTYPPHIGSLLFDCLYCHEVNTTGGGGGDFIDLRGGNIGSLTVQNSTFYASARTFLRISEADTESIGAVLIQNCTFNQVTNTASSSNNGGIFHIRYNAPSSFELKNCLFLNEKSEKETASTSWVRMARTSAENYAPTCSGNYYYNVGYVFQNDKGENQPNTFLTSKALDLAGKAFTETLALAGNGKILSEDPCTDSSIGKMYLTNGDIASKQIGDPRWWGIPAPDETRATELTPVSEDTTWDFTDRMLWLSENVGETTIIENIRIIAPAEITSKVGVYFAGASNVSGAIVPQSSAFNILVQGVGSVEFTALGDSANATVQVIADNEIFATVLADGATHRVVLGDIAGNTDVYVVPNGAMTFTSVSWLTSLEPEQTTTPLATPAVTVSPASFYAGDATDVTISWAAVENAAAYELTFNGQTQTLSADELSYTVPAATAATLRNGQYEISVVAKPVSTTTRYEPSEAGTAVLNVKVNGTLASVLWEFAKFDGKNIGGAEWKDNVAFGSDVTWTVNEDIPLTIMNGVSVAASSSVAKLGGNATLNSIPEKRALYFTAPYPGTLTVIHKPASNGAERALYVTVVKDGKATTVHQGEKITTQTQEEIDLGALEGGETVYIHSDGNNVISVRFDYVIPKDEGTSYTYDWNFTTYTPTAAAQLDTSGKLLADDAYEATDSESGDTRTLNILSTGSNWTLDAGKQLKSGGASKFTKQTDTNDPTIIYYTASGRAFSFVAQGGGTLYLTMKSASSSDTNRAWAVSADRIYYDSDGKTYLSGNIHSSTTCPPSSNTEAEVIDCSDVEAGQTIYITVAGAINFVDVKWVETR